MHFEDIVTATTDNTVVCHMTRFCLVDCTEIVGSVCWRQQKPLKSHHTSTGLYNVPSQRTLILSDKARNVSYDFWDTLEVRTCYFFFQSSVCRASCQF
jgi:hypothetical protein